MSRRRRVLIGCFLPVVILLLIFLPDDQSAPGSPVTPSMTFGWKSRVRLHGHGKAQKTAEEENAQNEEMAIANVLRTIARGEGGNGSLTNSRQGPLSSSGLLKIWSRNQLHIVYELQNLIKNEVAADDPAVIAMIQRSLVPPSTRTLKTSHGVRMTNLVDTVDRILGSKENGFFVEVNALDGEGSSHTLWLEKVRGWTGLLVEPDPSYFLQILGKNRKSWLLNANISPSRLPALVVLEDGEQPLGSRGFMAATSGAQSSRHLVPAYPLHSVLDALEERTHVDFLCVDVGGDEWAILQTIPFDEIYIKVIAVGVARSPIDGQQYVDLLTRHGYRCNNNTKNRTMLNAERPVYIVCNQEDPDTFIYQDEI